MSDNLNILNKIKEKGYWVVNIHPTKHREKIVKNRQDLKSLVQSSVVELRGWDYPHFSNNHGDLFAIDNGIQNSYEWDKYLEFWRFSLSGNFIHFFNLVEDYNTDSTYNNIWSTGEELKGKKLLGVLGALYTIAEIFEFAKRLSLKGLYKDSQIHIRIELHDIYERHLFVQGRSRLPFINPPKSMSSKPWVWEEVLNNATVLKTEDHTYFAFIDLIDTFNWSNPPLEVIKEDISKFIQGKIE